MFSGWSMAQVVEHLPSKLEALSSNSKKKTAKKNMFLNKEPNYVEIQTYFKYNHNVFTYWSFKIL
jgi:hypothetical protein